MKRNNGNGIAFINTGTEERDVQLTNFGLAGAYERINDDTSQSLITDVSLKIPGRTSLFLVKAQPR